VVVCRRAAGPYALGPIARVPGCGRSANGGAGHRLAQRQKGDAMIDAQIDHRADGVADIARHLEVDEHALASQRLQEGRQTSSQEQLQAHFEK
jgi:hypothetical protein